MIILGIETSCDETASAVLTNNDKRITILSNIVASSANLQAKYGGIIPEQAAREQIKSIIPVIETAIHDSRLTINDIDAIAVTFGPGLIGSLLVGVETAKTLALLWNKPLIPVNHLIGHFYANWINGESRVKNPAEGEARQGRLESSENNSRLSTLATSHLPQFPCLGLLVSGGHTDLVLFTNHNQYKYLGGTRDDATGECFDKCARLLNLPYPGGPQISKLAEHGNPDAFALPRPMIDSKNLDFSFSGLKTAVANLLQGHSFSTPTSTQGEQGVTLSNLAASIEQAIVDVLISKTITAAQKYNIDQIMVAGGVAANQKLISEFKKTINDKRLTITLHVPPPELCTDNAAMIAAAALYNPNTVEPFTLQTNPSLSLTTGSTNC